jgi:hypothetical protein
MAEFKINGTLNTTKGVKTKGTNYILVSAAGTAIENGNEFIAAFTAAQTMSPSSGSRITIVASPGYYEFQGADFEMAEPWVDLVSLDGNRSIKIIGSYTISVTTNDVYANGVDTGTLPFKVAGDLPGVTIENCKGGDYSFGFGDGEAIGVSSKFIDCEASNYSFGYTTGKGINANASGTFIRCTSGDYSFGSGAESDASQASGIFIDCTAGGRSFGALPGSVASGQFTRCIAGDYSFGNADASGVFMYCQGGQESFGKDAGNGGTITGKLYYCRKTTGDFTEVTSPGITRLCIDGGNVENNQG